MTATRGPIFVIGPSSVGKSRLCEAAAAELGVAHRDLDHELGGALLGNWRVVEARLDSITPAALVDIGAGTHTADFTGFGHPVSRTGVAISAKCAPRPHAAHP